MLVLRVLMFFFKAIKLLWCDNHVNHFNRGIVLRTQGSVLAKALSTYLVCWANPVTLVKMFMSAL